MEVLIGLVIGLIIGGGCIWFVKSSQIQSINSQKQANDEQIRLLHSQRENLSQENDKKQQQIIDLEEVLRTKENEIRNNLTKISNANAKLEKIDNLETNLNNEISKNQRFIEENTNQKEKISKLKADLENKEQLVSRLERDLEQQKSENLSYREAIEQSHSLTAKANASKEYVEKLKEEINKLKETNEQLQSNKTYIEKQLSSLETKLQEEQKSAQEKIELLKEAEQNLTSAFESLSSRALQNNNQQFLQAAKATFENIYQTSQHKIDAKHQAISDLISPLSKSLEAFDQKLNERDNAWSRDKGHIAEKLQSQVELMYRLQSETANLTKALRQPIVRGRWGEVQLKRVVEISGMQEHCDFSIQETVVTQEGQNQRPDLIVNLPGHKRVIVDSKAPLKAYLEALEVEEEF